MGSRGLANTEHLGCLDLRFSIWRNCWCPPGIFQVPQQCQGPARFTDFPAETHPLSLVISWLRCVWPGKSANCIGFWPSRTGTGEACVTESRVYREWRAQRIKNVQLIAFSKWERSEENGQISNGKRRTMRVTITAQDSSGVHNGFSMHISPTLEVHRPFYYYYVFIVAQLCKCSWM